MTPYRFTPAPLADTLRDATRTLDSALTLAQSIQQSLAEIVPCPQPELRWQPNR